MLTKASMPRRVWFEPPWPPMVPVPMARRLVRMPVWPRTTSSRALNLWGRGSASIHGGSGFAACALTVDESHAAPTAWADLRRNSLRCMRALLALTIHTLLPPGNGIFAGNRCGQVGNAAGLQNCGVGIQFPKAAPYNGKGRFTHLTNGGRRANKTPRSE